MKDGAGADWPALEVYIKTGQFSQKYSLVRLVQRSPQPLVMPGDSHLFWFYEL